MNESIPYTHLKERGALIGGQWPAEEVTVPFRTMQFFKVGLLLGRFDALGDHHILKTLSHIYYGAHDFRIVGILGDLADKRLVNLQRWQGEIAEGN